MTEDALRDFSGDIFILYGDTPLLRPETLERMRVVKSETGADLVMLTASGDIPGRVLRDADGRVARIIDDRRHLGRSSGNHAGERTHGLLPTIEHGVNDLR